MATSNVVVSITGMLLLAGVIALALYVKADVKAGAKFKGGEFFIEATDKHK